MKYFVLLSRFIHKGNLKIVNYLTDLLVKYQWNNKLVLYLGSKEWFENFLLNKYKIEKIPSALNDVKVLTKELIVMAIILLLSITAFISIWFIFKSGTSLLAIIGTIGTLLAAISAAWAAWAAQESNKKSEQDSKKNAFDRRFTLLIEQHNRLLTETINYLNTTEGNKFTKPNIMISQGNGRVQTAGEATATVRGHRIFSPYMRVLYHLLKSIRDELDNGSIYESASKEEKSYSNIVRSLIPNEILTLVAINSLFIYSETNALLPLDKNKNIDDFVYNDYHKYFTLLNRYSFFEHLVIDDENDYEYKLFSPDNIFFSEDIGDMVFYINGSKVFGHGYVFTSTDSLININRIITTTLKSLSVNENIWLFFKRNSSFSDSRTASRFRSKVIQEMDQAIKIKYDCVEDFVSSKVIKTDDWSDNYNVALDINICYFSKSQYSLYFIEGIMTRSLKYRNLMSKYK